MNTLFKFFPLLLFVGVGFLPVGADADDIESINRVLAKGTVEATLPTDPAEFSNWLKVRGSGVFKNCKVGIHLTPGSKKLHIQSTKIVSSDTIKALTGDGGSGYNFTFKKIDGTWKIIACDEWIE